MNSIEIDGALVPEFAQAVIQRLPQNQDIQVSSSEGALYLHYVDGTLQYDFVPYNELLIPLRYLGPYDDTARDEVRMLADNIMRVGATQRYFGCPGNCPYRYPYMQRHRQCINCPKYRDQY